jgi:hypothetical protein
VVDAAGFLPAVSALAAVGGRFFGAAAGFSSSAAAAFLVAGSVFFAFAMNADSIA